MRSYTGAEQQQDIVAKYTAVPARQMQDEKKLVDMVRKWSNPMTPEKELTPAEILEKVDKRKLKVHEALHKMAQ
jgi:hypothetical protein